MQQDPYYSIVVTSRNDGHGGDLLKRMRLFLLGLLHQTRKYKLPIELVIVEWNPLPDLPRLHEILPKPGAGDVLTVRYVTVPPAVHNRYKRGADIPLFQMTAKNVGIRRAKGQFVLACNIDLLFSDPLFALLAAQNLDPKSYYRANRNDIPDEIDPSMSFEAQMQYAESHIIRRNGWDTRYKHVNAHWHGIPELGPISRWYTDRKGYRDRMRQKQRDREFYLLDMVASGDFTMLHRDAWIDIQGYVEVDLFALHLDSLAVAAARALGYTQVTFPREACTYHIDHSSGWSSMNPVQQLRFLEKRPAIDIGTLENAALYLLEHNVRLDLNAEDWGFANDYFEELVLVGS
jgi:hypothetical protein